MNFKKRIYIKYKVVSQAAKEKLFFDTVTAVLKKHKVNTPKGSYWTCAEVTYSLIKVAKKIGLDMQAVGVMLKYPDNAPYVTDADLKGKEVGHVLLSYNGWLIDFTLRQFKPKANFPHIEFKGSTEAKEWFGAIYGRPKSEEKGVQCGIWVEEAMKEIEDSLLKKVTADVNNIELSIRPFGKSTGEGNPDEGAFRVEVYKNGKRIGYADAYREMSGWYVFEVDVIKNERLKGVASKMYDKIEDLIGKKVLPQVLDHNVSDPAITKEAFLFWSKRRPDLVDDILEAVTHQNRKDITANPSHSGIEDKDYPYYHVSNHPEQPSIHEGSTRKYKDPIGIYLFPKGQDIDLPEWGKKKYRWDAKLKPGVKLCNLGGLPTSDINELFIKAGLSNSDIFEFIKNHSFKSDMEFVTEPSEIMDYIGINKKSSQKDFDANWYSWLESGDGRNGWYSLLREMVSNRTKFTDLFKNSGYQGIEDNPGEYFFIGEPQVVIFDEKNIEWLPKEDNVKDNNVYKMTASGNLNMNFKTKTLAKYEIIAGRKERLKEMLAPFYENPGSNKYDRPEYWDQLIPKVIKELKKDDRIVWFIKKARGTRPAFLKDKNPIDSDPRNALTSASIEDFLQELSHFISNAEVNNFMSVLNYTFKDQTIAKVMEDLKNLTAKDEAHASTKMRFVTQDADKTFMKLKDGWEWHLLDRFFCAKEGAAMKHCGNSPGKEGQRILSLREPVSIKGKKMWKPHATFIWKEDGSLGEMKGFANEKPSAEIHHHILELLKHEGITKLAGGGYLTKNNFRVSDLSPENKEALEVSRKDLVDGPEIDIEDLIERINKEFSNAEDGLEEGDTFADYEEYAKNDAKSTLTSGDLHNRVDRDVEEQIDLLKKIAPNWKSIIIDECTDVSLVRSMYSKSNELGSTPITEYSFSLSGDIVETLNQLSEEQFEEVTRGAEGEFNREGEASYNMDNSRFAAILNTKSLDEKITELLDAKFENGISSTLDKMFKDDIKIEDLGEYELKDKRNSDAGWNLHYTDKNGDEQVLFSIDIDDEDFMDSFKKSLIDDYNKYSDPKVKEDRPSA